MTVIINRTGLKPLDRRIRVKNKKKKIVVMNLESLQKLNQKRSLQQLLRA